MSFFSFFIISINWFIVIYRFLCVKIIFLKWCVYFVIVVIWCIFFVVFVFLLVVNNIKNIGILLFFSKWICNEYWDILNGKELYNILVFILIFLILFIVMVFVYIKISLVLWRNNDKFII